MPLSASGLMPTDGEVGEQCAPAARQQIDHQQSNAEDTAIEPGKMVKHRQEYKPNEARNRETADAVSGCRPG